MNIYSSTARTEGGCNECRKNSQEHGDFRVHAIIMGSLIVRLCDECLSELTHVLSIHANESKRREGV